MTYQGRIFGGDVQLSPEKEGLQAGNRFLDYARVEALRPLNHRIQIDLAGGEQAEVSMLGFSYDGFWEELMDRFSARSLEALFVTGEPQMTCEGDYETPVERGRGRVYLYPDAVCILPQTANALRLPLCFVTDLKQEGYWLRLTLVTGETFALGRLGYDSLPFFERTAQNAERVKKERNALLAKLSPVAAFPHRGLFRTEQRDLSWAAAFGPGVCAVELFTGDDAATYLYRFQEPRAVFTAQLELAMEAMGPHREIIWQTEEQLAEKPLYQMGVRRSAAVRFLRARTAGRIIHNARHAEALKAFLNGRE